MPPPFTISALLTEASPINWLAVVLVLAAAWYLRGVRRLRLRGEVWPVSRTAFFLVTGLGSVAAVTLSGLGAYDTTLLSADLVKHLVLSMVAPIFLALGAPVTLALRTLSAVPRERLVRVLHSRTLRILAFPLCAFTVFVATPFALYFTDLQRLSLERPFVHGLVHAHLVLSGCLFFWPLLGLDPLPGRWPYPARALLMVLSVPLHAVLGLTITESVTLIGGDWYPSLRLGWADPWADQELAGGILWAGGEAVSVTMMGVLVVRWIRYVRRATRRMDRGPDRHEARKGVAGSQAV